MSAEERLKMIAAAVNGMTQREWWGIVEAVEILYEEAKTEVALTDSERVDEVLSATKINQSDPHRTITVEVDREYKNRLIVLGGSRCV